MNHDDVGGNSIFDKPGTVFVYADASKGNVRITDTAPRGVKYTSNHVAGNLSCSGNSSVTNDGFPNTVLGHESGQCVRL